MISKTALYERFMRDSNERRLGGIASDLMRLANCAKSPSVNEAFFDGILNEVKFFTEWSARDLRFEAQEKILNLQRTLASWADRHPSGAFRRIENEARSWSQELLNISGLL